MTPKPFVLVGLVLCVAACSADAEVAGDPDAAQRSASSGSRASSADASAADDFELRLRSRTFTPPPGVDPALDRALADGSKQRVHAIVQFARRPSTEDFRRLDEAGVRLMGGIGRRSSLASLPGGIDLSAARWRGLVRAATPFEPEDKLAPSLLRDPPDWAVERDTGRLRVLVEFFADVGTQEGARILDRLDVRRKPYSDTTHAVLVDRSKLLDVARLDGVKSIWPGPKPWLPLVDTSRRWTHTDRAQVAWIRRSDDPDYSDGASGAGVRIGICDDTEGGIYDAHHDFYVVKSDGSEDLNRSKLYATRAGASAHATHVASIAAGTGQASDKPNDPGTQALFQNRGHAPDALLGDYPQAHANTSIYQDVLVTGQSQITNHSYAQTLSDYDSDAANIDRIIRGDATAPDGTSLPARPQVWSAGNNGQNPISWVENGVTIVADEEGYFGVLATAKNAIAVGAIDTLDGRLAAYSALGPTADGRIKPDIVAPGSTNSIAPGKIGLRGASDSGPDAYNSRSGTSAAAPAVSGILALLMHHYEKSQGVFPTVRPATYRAVLIHTAQDLVKLRVYPDREFDEPDLKAPVLYHAGPDRATGWGLVDAGAARHVFGQPSLWRESSIASTADEDYWCIHVAAGAPELKVTIAWDDAPGPTAIAASEPRLENDLNLVVTREDDPVQHLPWVLQSTGTPVPSGPDVLTDLGPAKRGVDHTNNVEMVTVPEPAAGDWTATIGASDLEGGASQTYTIVSSEPILGWCPGPAADICETHPWVCEAIRVRPVVTGTSIAMPPAGVLPLDDVCRFVVDCPGCEGRPWEYCPGWSLELEGLPATAQVVLFDEEGKERARSARGGATRRLGVDRVAPGERFFMTLADASGAPVEKPLELRYRLRPRRGEVGTQAER